MPTHTKYTRRGGKKKTLVKTKQTSIEFSDSRPEVLERDENAARHLLKNMTLKARLEQAEKAVTAILKEHGIPAIWPEVSAYRNSETLPLAASYAADIMSAIHQIRDYLKQNKAESAAVAGWRLGESIALLHAETTVAKKGTDQTNNAIENRKESVKMRQERMKKIAIEKGWKPGKELRKTELQAVYTLLRERHPEYKDKPDNRTLSADALEIGLRQ